MMQSTPLRLITHLWNQVYLLCSRTKMRPVLQSSTIIFSMAQIRSVLPLQHCQGSQRTVTPPVQLKLFSF